MPRPELKRLLCSWSAFIAVGERHPHTALRWRIATGRASGDPRNCPGLQHAEVGAMSRSAIGIAEPYADMPLEMEALFEVSDR